MTINISLLFQDNKMKFSGYEICLAWLEIDQSTCFFFRNPYFRKKLQWKAHANNYAVSQSKEF